MTLRSKLIALQSGILLLMAALVGGTALFFTKTAVPLMEQGVRTKARACIENLRATADVGLATEDATLLQAAIARCEHFGSKHDPDLGFVAIYGPGGSLLASVGTLPPNHPQRLPRESSVTRTANGYRGRAPVAIEGKTLGSVLVEYRLDRVRGWQRWQGTFTGVAVVFAMLSALASILFALHLIRPLREMLAFVHRVARGDFGARLSVRASDELGQLAEDLVTMADRLRDSRDSLSTASRQAGMAEVATSVLHNVGNVLNSVNVSASMASEKVRRLRVEGVANLAALLAEQEGDLGRLSQHPRADLLPDYTRALSEHLHEERASILSELGDLERHVDHIKAVVSTQQSLARQVALVEAVDVSAMIDVALQVHATRLSRARVDVVRDDRVQGPITIDKHKVLQILINLVANATDALGEAQGGPRRLRIRSSREGDVLRIAVADDGCGIAAENLSRVFESGFTTKPSGHGFGLHASANAATEMGGRLTCESGGVGRGAVFTLELPLALAQGGDTIRDRDEGLEPSGGLAGTALFHVISTEGGSRPARGAGVAEKMRPAP